MDRNFIVILPALLVLGGCGDLVRPVDPSSGVSVGPTAGAALPTQQVTMMDACDPTSFNDAIGPGTCVREGGGVTFQTFIGQLTGTQKAGSWVFAPSMMTARVGQQLLAINRGGEVHTFTRVDAFGGGFINDLNQLSGNPVPAPECLNFGALVFVPPGGTDGSEDVEGGATQLFQCCVHPWMRTTVHAH